MEAVGGKPKVEPALATLQAAACLYYSHTYRLIHPDNHTYSAFATLRLILRQTPNRFLYHFFMKTTLNLNDDPVAQAKAVATKERISLTKLIDEGLVLRLRQATFPQACRLAGTI